MKSVYVGKNVNGKTAICKVLDCDIATGDAKVFNRKTRKIEILKFEERISLPLNVRKLAEDTPELDGNY